MENSPVFCSESAPPPPPIIRELIPTDLWILDAVGTWNISTCRAGQLVCGRDTNDMAHLVVFRQTRNRNESLVRRLDAFGEELQQRQAAKVERIDIQRAGRCDEARIERMLETTQRCRRSVQQIFEIVQVELVVPRVRHEGGLTELSDREDAILMRFPHESSSVGLEVPECDDAARVPARPSESAPR